MLPRAEGRAVRVKKVLRCEVVLQGGLEEASFLPGDADARNGSLSSLSVPNRKPYQM